MKNIKKNIFVQYMKCTIIAKIGSHNWSKSEVTNTDFNIIFMSGHYMPLQRGEQFKVLLLVKV